MIKLYECDTIEELELKVNEFEKNLGKLVKCYISHQELLQGGFRHFATIEYNPFTQVQELKEESVKFSLPKEKQDGAAWIDKKDKNKLNFKLNKTGDKWHSEKLDNFEESGKALRLKDNDGISYLFVKNPFKKADNHPVWLIYEEE